MRAWLWTLLGAAAVGVVWLGGCDAKVESHATGGGSHAGGEPQAGASPVGGGGAGDGGASVGGGDPDPRPPCPPAPDPPPAAVCGNGVQELGETCDQTSVANGSCVDCVLSCDAGFDDCNGRDDDGCEAALQNDAANCTACGVVCDTCVAGSCTLAADFATGQNQPYRVAVDASGAYWTNRGIIDALDNVVEGDIRWRPVTGGTPQVLVPNRTYPTEIAVDDTHVFWLEGEGTPGDHAIWRVAKDGSGAPELLHDGLTHAHFALAGDKILFSSASAIHWMNKDGTVPAQIGSVDNEVFQLVVRDQKAYAVGGPWFEDLWDMRLDCAEGPTKIGSALAEEEPVAALAVDDSHIYYLHTQGGGGKVYVKQMPLGTTTTTTLLSEDGYVCTHCANLALASDSVLVGYFDQGVQFLSRVPTQPGAAQPLAQATTPIVHVVVVGDLVYWVVQGDPDAGTGYLARQRL